MPSGRNCFGSDQNVSSLWFGDSIEFFEEMNERSMNLKKEWSTLGKDILELTPVEYNGVVKEKTLSSQSLKTTVGDDPYWSDIADTMNVVKVSELYMFGKVAPDTNGSDVTLAVSVFSTAVESSSFEESLVVIDCEDTLTVSQHDCPKPDRYSGTLMYGHLYSFYGVPLSSVEFEKTYVTGSAQTIDKLIEVVAAAFIKQASDLVLAYRNWPLIKLSREDMCVRDKFLRLNVLLFGRKILISQVSELPKSGSSESFFYTSYYGSEIMFEGKKYFMKDNESVDTFFGSFVNRHIRNYVPGISSSLIIPSKFPVSIVHQDFKEEIVDLLTPYLGMNYLVVSRKILNSPLPSCDMHHGMHWFLWHDYYIRKLGGLDVGIYDVVSAMNTFSKGKYLHDNCVKIGRNFFESYISAYIGKRNRVVDQSFISSLISSCSPALKGCGFHLCWGSFADSGSHAKWVNGFLSILGAVSLHSPNAVFKICDAIFDDYLDIMIEGRPKFPVNLESRYASSALNVTGKMVYYRRDKKGCDFYDTMSSVRLTKEDIAKKLNSFKTKYHVSEKIKSTHSIVYSKYT
jgi:hypothetical protein